MRRLAAVLVALALSGCDNEVPILLYHFVGAGTDLPWDMSDERFRAHLDELQAAGFNTVSLRQLHDARENGADLPANPLVITFDDGEVGVYRHAYPALRERGMCAELFLVENLIGADSSSRQRWRQGDWDLTMLVWPEVQEMVDSGTLNIGSHTLTHPLLATVPLEHAQREIEDSRRRLGERLGRPIDFFAYPGHSLNADLMGAVENAGYLGAVAGKNRLGGRFGLWRISVFSGDGIPELRRKLARSWADDWAQ